MNQDTQKQKTPSEPSNAVVAKLSLPRTIHLVPLDCVDGFEIRPGFYEINGATAIPGGVNFTVYSEAPPPLSFCCSIEKKTSPSQSSLFRNIIGSAMSIP